MRAPARTSLLWLGLLGASGALSFGCSSLINPDEGRLGGDLDAGMDRRDTGTPPVDSGRRDTGLPPVDSGRTDTGVPPVDGGGGGCDPAEERCEGGVAFACVGDELRELPCALGCAPGGAPRCAELVPSNVAPEALPFVGPELRLDRVGVFPYDTDFCEGAGIFTTEVVAQSDGTELCVVAAGEVFVSETTTFRVRGSRPLVILAAGEVRIEGTLDVSAYGAEPGAGGGAAGVARGSTGGGLHPGAGGGHVESYADGGGGGGGLVGPGGRGGTGGMGTGGAGGSPSTDDLLQPLTAGSGGGVGEGTRPGDATAPGSGATTFGVGGAGGGAVQISSRVGILVRGAILAGGGGGAGGRVVPTSGTVNWGAGGGGGSGGGILLEAPTVALSDTGLLIASGGGGGGGASDGMNGGAGQDGATSVGRSAGGTRGADRLGADGGRGGGGGALNGETGNSNSNGSGNGGGGGGSAGRVVIRNLGAVALTAGVVSPTVDPGLAVAEVVIR